MNNTLDRTEWDNYLREACRTWPTAAEYLQNLAGQRHRWGYPWRMDALTLGYQASSPAESSFSALKRSTDYIPVSFAAAIQHHLRKDMDKIAEERAAIVNRRVQSTDPSISAKYNDAVNQCRSIYSKKISMVFNQENIESLNYDDTALEISDADQLAGVEERHKIVRRILADEETDGRIVEKINGVWYCKCRKNDNFGGGSFRHIQRANGGAFDDSIPFLD